MALGGILTLAAIICVIIILTTGFYSVPADSVGVVQRFGKYIDTTGAGPHFKIPLGVDAVSLVLAAKGPPTRANPAASLPRIRTWSPET